jgi:hypothetical protein
VGRSLRLGIGRRRDHAGVGWWMMGLGIFFTVVVGGGLMALVFYSSRVGYDEPPHLAQKRKTKRRHKNPQAPE